MPVIDLGWLVDVRPPAPSFWYLGLAALFAVVLVGSALVYYFRRDIFPPRSAHLRVVPRFATWGAVLGGVGLALVLARYLGVPYLSMRLWLVLATLAVPAYAGYVAYFYRTRFPSMRAVHQAEEARLKYVRPTASQVAGGSRRRSKKRRR